MEKEIRIMRSLLRAITKIYDLMDIYIKKNDLKKLEKASMILEVFLERLQKVKILSNSEDALLLSSISLDIIAQGETLHNKIKNREDIIEMSLYDPKSTAYSSNGNKTKKPIKSKGLII